MPAGFNKGQIEYIKAVANVNGHKTYKPISFPATANYTADHLTDVHDSATYFHAMCLTRSPLVRNHEGSTPVANSIEPLSDLVDVTDLDALTIVHETDTDNPFKRRTTECFLESTHLNFRMCQLNGTGGAFSDLHSEYRMIVFRARDVQNDDQVRAMDHSNWLYNLFHGRANYKIGFKGVQRTDAEAGLITYVQSTNSADANIYWADQVGCFNLPVNKEDYVV